MTWIFIKTPEGESIVNLSQVVRVIISKDPGKKEDEALYTIRYHLSGGETLTATADKEQKLRVINLFHHENGMMSVQHKDE